MNRFYIIIPVVLLAIFGVFYWQHAQHAEEAELVKKAALQKAQDEDLAKKRAAEEKAKADAAKRTAEREAEEKKKENDRIAKYQDRLNKIKAEFNRYKKEGDAAAKEGAQLELDLNEIRAQKEKLNREAFDLAKKVELARVAKRNAEFEIQRKTEMIARRASSSALTKPPAVAVAAP